MHCQTRKDHGEHRVFKYGETRSEKADDSMVTLSELEDFITRDETVDVVDSLYSSVLKLKEVEVALFRNYK